MKISESTDSWHASGVLRRDFRHTHNGPEVPRHVGKRKRKPPAKRSDHKHVYVMIGEEQYAIWGQRAPWSWRWEHWRCAEDGCDKIYTKFKR